MNDFSNNHPSYLIVSVMLIKRRLRFGSFEFQNCQYVIIGTDAGGDDAQAIVLTVAEAKRTNKTILGITCVDGNAYMDDVTRNPAMFPLVPIF